MPWDELTPRQFPAFEKELDGISRKNLEDHYKLYQGYIKKSNALRARTASHSTCSRRARAMARSWS